MKYVIPNIFKFGIFHKFLLFFLGFSMLPLIIMGIISFFTLQNAGDKIVLNTVSLIEDNVVKNLTIQSSSIARDFESFLRKCENDIIQLSRELKTKQNFKSFSDKKIFEIWTREYLDDKIGVNKFIPIYKELSFVDLSGIEKIKIVEGEISADLRDLSKERTKYFEDYFRDLKTLKEGELFVSRLNGLYISMKDYTVDPVNSKYDGIIRFATPVYENGVKTGYVTFGVDHQVILEFTQHVLPNSSDVILNPSYESGDYAFIFDDEGWILTHPKIWDIKGFDINGRLVPAYTSKTPVENIDDGIIPFNLDSAGFIHQNYPLVAQNVRKGESGTVITKNVAGLRKVMVYTPIYYNKGVYSESNIFGGITLGTEIQKFYLHSKTVSSQMSRTIESFLNNILLIMLIAITLSIGFSYLLTKNLTRPIIHLTNLAKNFSEGDLSKRLNIIRNDEIGVLASTINKMADELEKGRNQIFDSFEQLSKSKNEIEVYSTNLEYQIRILKSILEIGNIIGSTFELNDVLEKILQTCVESVNFDRAILYLIDDSGDYVECRKIYGFSESESQMALNSKYNIQHSDCIETRVIRSGEIVYVEDFNKYSQATELDKKIRDIAGSNSFVFIPLFAKEKIIGLLGADKLRSNIEIKQNDINSLQVLANQASRVIENTRLYSEIISQRNFVKDIISNMINGVISTNGRAVITSYNKSAAEILKFAEVDLIGKSIWDILELTKSLKDPMRESLEKTGIYRGYSIKVDIKNETKYLNINASRIYNEGVHTGTIIIFEDVTEKKFVDEELQKIEKLASLGRFATGIAHEIRNPLTGLSLFLDNLHDQLLTSDPNSSALLVNALNEVERLDKLVNEIIDFTLPGKIDMLENDINSIIDSILMLVQPQCEHNDVRVIKKLSYDIRKFLFDEKKIRQAILNIVLNSVQILKNGGEIIIITQVNPKNKNQFAEIIIQDNGPGFNDKEINMVFDPFYSNKKGGVGLGLSITKTIIDEHKGKLVAKNRKNGGAEIIISLPMIGN